MSRVLAVGDQHEPWAHPMYLSFVRDLRDKYKCDKIVFIGDEIDSHSISFHPKHPEAPGPLEECIATKKALKRWHRVFPKVSICIGNHTERVFRLAESVNIPGLFIKGFSEVWETPGWTWKRDYVIDDVYYFHGTGTSGVHPAFCSMQKLLMSVVQGHCHAAFGVKWRSNPTRRIFACDTGCGVDDRQIAFAYGRTNQIRSMLGAAVILDGIPIPCVMDCSPGEKYHRNKARRNK